MVISLFLFLFTMSYYCTELHMKIIVVLRITVFLHIQLGSLEQTLRRWRFYQRAFA